MEESERNKIIKEAVGEAIALFYANMPKNQHQQPSPETMKLITDLSEQIKRLDERFEPINDNYLAAIKLGKWFMGLLIFIGALGTAIGAMATFTSIFKK